MRSMASICLSALLVTFTLAGTPLAAEEGTRSEAKKKEQVLKKTDQPEKQQVRADAEESTWSNVKALWG